LTFEKFCGLVFGFIGLEIVVLIMFLRCENEVEIGMVFVVWKIF